MKLNLCMKLNPNSHHCFDPYNRRHFNLMQVGVIDRKVFNKGFFGNFVPHWARYKGKELLVHGGIDYNYMHNIDVNGLYVVVND